MAEAVADIGEDVEDLHTGAKQVIEDVREEIRVFEVEQQREVDADTENQPKLTDR